MAKEFVSEIVIDCNTCNAHIICIGRTRDMIKFCVKYALCLDLWNSFLIKLIILKGIKQMQRLQKREYGSSITKERLLYPKQLSKRGYYKTRELTNSKSDEYYLQEKSYPR